jgi:Leucine-rich repeat (LRR) protein
MNFKTGSSVSNGDLEGCLVAFRASPGSNAKTQAASPHIGYVNMRVKPQPAGAFSYNSLKDGSSPTPDTNSHFGNAKVSIGSTKLPLVHVGRGILQSQSTDVAASHLHASRRSAAPVLIKQSMLEKHGHIDENGNVVSCICVGMSASGFDIYDSQFNHLESVDLGDNKIPFANAAVFPALKMLNLYCNGITSLQHPELAFKCLEVLNLSFNLINADALSPLFSIKSLVVIDLSFNMISRIPNRWHSLPLLKILSLEKNGLHHEDTFSYLSLAPSLQELNLSSNCLSCVPSACSAPGRFPQLVFISLVDNAFAHEKDVVALSFVPSIQQVDLWNNPMSSNSGARARSRHALKYSRSPSPEHPNFKAQLQDGALRVATPANFERSRFVSASNASPPPPVVSISKQRRRALVDIEQEARDVFRDGCEPFHLTMKSHFSHE